MQQHVSQDKLPVIAQQWDDRTSTEKKIRDCLKELRTLLSQPPVRSWHELWQLRQLCLSLFKTPLAPKIRFVLWKEYLELASEVKRSREQWDEQAIFVCEQIELALKALESDAAAQEMLEGQLQDEPLLHQTHTLQQNALEYQQLHKQLTVATLLATRIAALRVEVLKTSMRMRIKNQFLRRLGACSQLVLPRRKEKLHHLGKLWTSDIQRFIEKDSQSPSFSPSTLRKEVKQLQAVAKLLPLSSATFMQVRLQLSSVWDRLAAESAPVSSKRREYKSYSEQPMNAQKELCGSQEWERLKAELTHWVKQASQLPFEQRAYEKAQWSTKLTKCDLSAEDRRMGLDLLEKADWVAQEEEATRLLSTDVVQTPQEVLAALKAQQSHRQEIREQLEEYRKLLGGSGLDFEKAMYYREGIETQKRALVTVEKALEKLEEQCHALSQDNTPCKE